MELFEKYKVFSHREMHSRYEIGLEQYALSIGVEARLTLEMGTTTVLPAAIRYQTELATNVGALKAVGVEADAVGRRVPGMTRRPTRTAGRAHRSQLSRRAGGARPVLPDRRAPPR